MPDWLNVSIFAITQVMMLVGLLGLLVPIFPGTVVMWLAALGYGIVSGFTTLGWVMFAIITVLMLAATLVDNVFMGAGARKGGASWNSILLALVAGVLGTIFFPPIGGIIAAPLAVLLLEYMRQRDWQKAWQALRGLATGFGLSVLVRFGIGMLMMILWWVWAAN
jgi:uncharacterized protein YqgC (DUF456 family)